MEIHQYDIQSGKYLMSFPSQRDFEREKCIYRGSVVDIMKQGGRRRDLLISTERHEIHPSFLPDSHKGLIKEEIPKTSMLSEDELRIKHDMYYQIQLFIKDIPEGKFVEESSMLKQLSLLGKARYRDAISRPELKEYKGRVDGTTYYGSPASIKKLKSEGILQ
jgi:hypothetical protein